MRTLALLALMLLTAGPAHADVMYSYAGDYFHGVSGAYTTAMRLDGYFVVPELLVFPPGGAGNASIFPDVLRYSFSDGLQTQSSPARRGDVRGCRAAGA